MENGRRVGKGRVRKVEEEAGYGKGRDESQCERGYRGEDDVCSGNFIYYFSHWHYWIIDYHVDVNWHYDTADCNKLVYWNKQQYSVPFRCSTVFSEPKLCSKKWRVFYLVFSRSRHISHFFTSQDS